MADPNLAQILTEKSWYIGQYVASVLSGVQISLCIQSCYYLAYSRYSFKQKAALIAYGVILCLLVSITLAGNQVEGLYTWIVHRDGPGGPEAYLDATLSAWWDVFGTASILTADIMGNALLLYRCYVLLSHWTLVIPAVLFIGSSAMAIVTVVESAMPNATVFSGISVRLAIAWVSLSVGFNLLVTSLICGRVFVSYLALKRMSFASLARERWGLVAIMIESSLPFSIFGIVLVSVYSLAPTNPDSQLVSAMADTWGGIVGITPQLIILRVAMGHAWTKNNVSSASADTIGNMKFEQNYASTTRVIQGSTGSIGSKVKDLEKASTSASRDDGFTNATA